MNSLDWIMYGLLTLILGGLVLALFLYLRTAYRSGGWKRVGRDFVIAIVTILIFFFVRMVQNSELDSITEAVSRWFK